MARERRELSELSLPRLPRRFNSFGSACFGARIIVDCHNITTDKNQNKRSKKEVTNQNEEANEHNKKARIIKIA